MIFIPLPLVASLLLAAALIWFVANRNMALRAHQLFAALVFGYFIQSVLLCLRWGYGIGEVALPIAILAPVLPVLAWFAYQSLSGQRKRLWWWPLCAIALCWGMLVVSRDLTDLAILLTYIGIGALILWRAGAGEPELALSPILETRQILFVMRLTGAGLMLAGLMDVFVIVDFIRTGGQNVGAVTALAQTLFVLVIGLASTSGRSGTALADDAAEPQAPPEDTAAEDADVIARLEALFAAKIHRDEDLSLRKLARRLGLPDRRVSNAINRVEGMNVSQYVNGFRIRDACERLATTEDGILQISIDVGFASKSNFNREFYRSTGQTPSDWRAANTPGSG